ncbi:unnamed protein product [Soboliphyme baturini]|uniref:Tnp_zf-ribbon_2 domain-containing protein n=1 Tax=Soboliphyme baturini TaxID=241478 RepID=A0A183J186_9BILA|nr:unnamed protein product [Soboliphyme baturini]
MIDSAPKCERWSQPNEWSDCMWFPISAMTKNLEMHCEVPSRAHELQINLPVPKGISIPDKCGFCSYRVRCHKRQGKEGCFPLKIDKKACGADDCPTCANICTVKAQNGSCNWIRHLEVTVRKQLHMKSMETKMPFWRSQGYAHIIKYLPHGVCKKL